MLRGEIQLDSTKSDYLDSYLSTQNMLTKNNHRPWANNFIFG